jgi:hypothetical protein
MDKKTLILEFIAKNPGVLSVDINVGLGRASVGAHTRALMDAGMLIRDINLGWHLADGFILKLEPKQLTPIDIAGEFIRKMVDANKR